MSSKEVKDSTSTASRGNAGKVAQPQDDSEDELALPSAKKPNSAAQQEAPPATDPPQGESSPAAAAAAPAAEVLDNRSLEEILSSIPPPPLPVMTNEPGTPRLMITHLVNRNFKSYAGERKLGPFHKCFSCIIGPNGSGKSNVIDSMLFVFGYRAQKIRSKKLSVLIHSSEHRDAQSCTVEVHFQKIIDKEGDDYEVIPNSRFYVSRTAHKDNTSTYYIDGKKATFKEVGARLRSHGIDLDHNRFLILQGEVEQIALMKPKAQTEHEEGMLEYLEDLIGTCRFKKPIQTLCQRIELLNEQRGEKLNRVKLVEMEKNELEVEKNKAMQFLALEEEFLLLKNQLCQYQINDLQKLVVAKGQEKQKILEDGKELIEKNAKISVEVEKKNQELKDVEVQQNKLKQYIEIQKQKFSQLELQDVEVREKNKDFKSKVKKLNAQLKKDKEKEEELRNILACNKKAIADSTAQKEKLEKQKVTEEDKLKEVMESLMGQTGGLQQDKKIKEEQLMALKEAVNETRSRRDLAQSELDLYLSRHNTALTKLNKAKETLESTTSTLRERRAAIKDLEVKIPRLEKEIKKDEDELEQLTKMDNVMREAVKEIRQQVYNAKSSLSSSCHRGKVLDAIMQQKTTGNIKGIYGRLGDLGAIDEKYDVAISSSCGALDNIVVDTINTAQLCVAYLKKHNIGYTTFIGLDKVRERCEKKMGPLRTPENCPRLFDLVRVKDEAVRPAFYFALGDTLVAQNMEQATRLAFQKEQRLRVVTLNGQVIERSGTMSGGGNMMKGRMGSSFTAELSQDEVDRMERKLTDEESKYRDCQSKKTQLEDKLLQLKPALRQMKFDLEKYALSMKGLADQEIFFMHNLKELEADVLAATPDEAKQKRMEISLEDLEKDFQAASSKAGQVEKEVERLHNLIVETNSHKLKAQQDKLDKIIQKLDDYSSTITKAQVAAKTAERNLQKCEESMNSVQAQLEENQTQLAKLVEEMHELEKNAGETIEVFTKAEAKVPEINKQHEAVVIEIKTLQQQERALQEESLSIRLHVEQIDATIAEHNNKIQHWQKEASKLSPSVIRDEPQWKLPVLTATDLDGIKDIHVLVNEIVEVETRLACMKPNLSAIGEFKKKEDLYLQRVAQLEELTKQRDAFKHSCKHLRQQRFTEFMTGFNIISHNLKENYQKLTLGGDAELELVDSMDPFSEGIAFSVRPPMKSWKRIFNLSGGEKTLSSLALVFSLHKYKPTPLYFMDEIDAALDERNVTIVSFFIYEQTKNAQFIIISLRHNMFQRSDHLIGVYKTYNTSKSLCINPKAIANK